MDFIKQIFSDNGIGSSSRVLTALTTAMSCWALGHVVKFTGHIPDAITMAGLASFATAPYVVNQVKAAVTSFSDKGS